MYNDINWEILRDALRWQSENVGASGNVLKFNDNCVNLTAASTMSVSLALKVCDEVNIEALKKLAVDDRAGKIFSSSPWGMIYYLEDCTEFRRIFLDCHGKLKYGVEHDKRIIRARQLYAKWVNITQALAELWGPDPNCPREQNIHFFSAKKLVYTFIAPITLQTLRIAIEGLVGTIRRMRAFFSLPDHITGFLEVATTGKSQQLHAWTFLI